MSFKFAKKCALTLTAASLAVAGMATDASAYTAGKTYKFTVLHVNDTHGHFWEDNIGQGGFPYLKTIIDQIRKEEAAKGNSVLVLHAGDFNTGVPESDLQKALPDIVGMNAIGFDAVAVGNHEFDVSYPEMLAQLYMLKAPLLSANVFYTNPETKKEQQVYPAYTAFKRGDLNFLVVGTTTPSTKYQANPEHTENFTFIDPAQAYTKAVKEAEKETGVADVVIALNHLGFYANGQHGDNPYGDYLLAQKVNDKKLALSVSGHTHNFGCVDAKGEEVWPKLNDLSCTVPVSNGVPIVQVNKWGRYVGRADFEFKDGKATLVNYQLIPVNLKEKQKIDGKTHYQQIGPVIKPDPELYQALKVYQDAGNKELLKTVGKIDGTLTPSRLENTKIAALIADAQKHIAKADVAVMNSGGIRDKFEAGPISYRDILIVQPFANSLATVDLTGKELEDYIRTIAFYEGGGFPNYSGVTFDMDTKAKTVSNFKVNGQPIDYKKTYKLVVLSFLASGGDKYPKINDKASYVDTGYLDAKALADYLTEKGEIKTADLVIEGPKRK